MYSSGRMDSTRDSDSLPLRDLWEAVRVPCGVLWNSEEDFVTLIRTGQTSRKRRRVTENVELNIVELQRINCRLIFLPSLHNFGPVDSVDGRDLAQDLTEVNLCEVLLLPYLYMYMH